MRVDSGDGSHKDIDWLLSRHYRVLIKDYSTAKARKLADSVRHWFDDLAQAGRQYGLVRIPHDYCQPVVRIAVRCRRNNQ